MWVWSKLSSAKWRDAWEERLHALADTRLVITELIGRKRVRVEMYCRRRADAARIQRQFGGRMRILKVQNWAALSAPQIPPIKIRDRLLVVSVTRAGLLARLRAAHPLRELLVIPIEMAFGTGDHPTTAACLRAMCDLDPTGRSVLDLGCGTGILALAAKKLGAGRVVAVDFDARAVAVSKENARRNRVRGVRFERRDILAWTPPGQFDVIVANLFANVLAASFPKLARALAPGGTAILSGVLEEHAADCLSVGRRAGWRFDRVIRRGKWVTAVGRMAQ
jgi:ribosomal protein L11 methyltransferase